MPQTNSEALIFTAKEADDESQVLELTSDKIW